MNSLEKISLKIPYEKVGLNPKNFHPELETVTLKFSPEIGIRKRPAVIICPGGGYEYLSDRETLPVAMRFASHGINAFILRYSINSPFPASLLELAYAVKYVRENAENMILILTKYCYAASLPEDILQPVSELYGTANIFKV